MKVDERLSQNSQVVNSLIDFHAASDQASNILREASAQAISSGSFVMGTPAAPVPSLFAKAQATCVDADE